MAQALRAAFRCGLIGTAMLGLAACGNSVSQPTASNPPPAAPPSAPPTAPVAQVTIKDVQNALKQGGYYKSGTVDGVWGPRTERAVRQYQQAHHMTANGKLDVPTLQAMGLTGSPPPTAGANNAPTDNNPPTDTNPPPNNNAANNPPATPATQPAGNTPPPANPPANGGTSGTNH